MLGAFDPEVRKRIDPYLEQVTFKFGDVVCEAGALLQHAYFPEGAGLSLRTGLESGDAIETANIGREGAFGLFAAMYSRESFNRCLVQLEGPMLRCKIELLQAEFDQSPHIRDLFVSYSETLLSQVQQTAACNTAHSVQERICRWLLMMHDRSGGGGLTYTHQFLADMMGVNRKSVTVAAQSMQAAGLINYHRGIIDILDRRGLEAAACECYATVRQRFDTFLTPPASAYQETKTGRRRTH